MMNNDDVDMEMEIEKPNQEKNVFISNLDNLNSLNIENDNFKALKIIHTISTHKLTETLENSNQTKIIKQINAINLFFDDSIERLDNLINFFRLATDQQKYFKFKSLTHTNVKQSEEADFKLVNFLKKKAAQNAAVDNFRLKLSKIKENNKISQSIFAELFNLKELGFVVDDNFKFPEISNTITIRLQHKILKIFEPIFEKKLSKHNFDLNYNTKLGVFELISNYINDFEKNFKIRFNLNITVNNIKHSIPIDMILDQILENSNIIYINNNINNPNKQLARNFVIFYLKYFLFKIFKLEIRNLKRILKTDHFEYKSIHYQVRERVNNFSIKLDYLDSIQFDFSAYKLKLDESISINTENKEKDNNNNSEFVEANKAIVTVLIKNLIFDTKIYRNIKEFFNCVVKAQSFNDIMDNSIFIKNLGKILPVILRKNFIEKINNLINTNNLYLAVKYNFFNIASQTHIYRFLIAKSEPNLFTPQKIEFIINFHKNNCYFETKTIGKNNIFTCEKELMTERLVAKTNFRLLYETIKNILEFNN